VRLEMGMQGQDLLGPSRGTSLASALLARRTYPSVVVEGRQGKFFAAVVSSEHAAREPIAYGCAPIVHPQWHPGQLDSTEDAFQLCSMCLGDVA